jgi:hypothetical protein
MNTVLFDTLKMVETLQAGGFTDQQARARTSALGDAATVAAIATRSDVLDLGIGMKHDFEALEQRMTIKMGGMLVVLAGVLSAAFHYLR